MTRLSSGIFIEGRSHSGERILQPAEILGSTTGGVFSAKLQTTELVCELGQELMLYYEKGTMFLKQPALVESCDASDGLAEIQFVFRGEPVSAEQRENYRVSAVVADLRVDISDESECKLVDVSVTGCSAIVSGNYDLGQHVQITLYHENEPITGKAIVRGVRQLDAVRIRLGLLCILGCDTDGTFKKGLREITMAVQRSQLRRLSGV